MSYTIIPELPAGGPENGYQVDAFQNLLVIEQDITRKITPFSFLTNSISQMAPFKTDISKWKSSLTFPISDPTIFTTQNVTLQNLMNYINTHLNVVDEVFFVSSLSGVDSTDYVERGRNEQLPFKTIKFAAAQISNLIALDANYQTASNPDSNYVDDNTVDPPQAVSKKVRRQYTIMVRSGDYVEDNPVYLPPNTSMIGDNLRRTTIRPKNPRLDMFWVDSANYIWGFTFRDHKAPAAAVAFPISDPIFNSADQGILTQYAPSDYSGGGSQWIKDSYNIAYINPLVDTNLPNTTYLPINDSVRPKKRPYIYVSPYTQGCTSYAISDRMPNTIVGDNRNNPLYPATWFNDDGPTPGVGGTPTTVSPPNNAGCGMRIDGSLVTGYFRSMVIDSFTQVNQGGKGIYLLNHGYAQFVSTFTVACEQGIVCEAGATCSISTSNSTFGLSGLVAKGMSYSPVLTGYFVIPGTQYYPTSSQSSANGNNYGVYGYSTGSNLFTINNVTPIAVTYPNDNVSDVFNTPDPLTGKNNYMYVASQPYATLCFTVGDDKPWITGYDGNNPLYAGPGYILEDEINPIIARTQVLVNSSLSATPMHQVKLFFIEQGPPTVSLSGGKTNPSNTNYDIYQTYPGLTYPNLNAGQQVNEFLPWDIQLSYNIALDLKNLQPLSAYDAQGRPLHFIPTYNSNVEPINYQIFDPANRKSKTLVPVATGTPNAQNQYEDHLRYTTSGPATIDFTNAPVKFYARSVLETGSHTFEYMGTGTRMKYAIPAFGGVTNNTNECAADGFNDVDQNGTLIGNQPGTVFFTSSNELGNFKVGTDFTIVQSTGTIQGDTFSRAILTLVTPLNIVLE